MFWSSNVFPDLETTAHTLAATLGFLAYYPEIQEEVYEHILSVIGKIRDPVSGAFLGSQSTFMMISIGMGRFQQAGESYRRVLRIPEIIP